MTDRVVRKPVLGRVRTEKLSEGSIPRNQHFLDFSVDLSEDEFRELTVAATTLTSFMSDQNLFYLVVLNLREFHETLIAYKNAYLNRHKGGFDNRFYYLEINRCALNWLSSVRTYLDHTELTIKRRHGEQSSVWDDFRQLCSDAYDQRLEYRFMYKLRNYAQHCGFPIHNIRIDVTPKESDRTQPAYALTIASSRDKLLHDFDGWGASLKSEIARMPEMIRITPMMDGMTRHLEAINSVHSSTEFGFLRPSAAVIERYIDRIPAGDGQPDLFEIDIVEDAHGKMKTIKTFVGHLLPLDLVGIVLRGSPDDLKTHIEVPRVEEE